LPIRIAAGLSVCVTIPFRKLGIAISLRSSVILCDILAVVALIVLTVPVVALWLIRLLFVIVAKGSLNSSENSL
jgi:hypothetical protein